jgi:amino-acid N-acetyltransferase
MFALRPAISADEAAIRRMVHAEHINPAGLDWRRFVVAVDEGGEVIGCGQVKPHRDGSRELASLVVVPAWRGRGVGRAIIEHLIVSHPGRLYLTCRSTLGPLYEKFGFRAIPPSEMTPYFRKLKRLAGVFELLARDSLLVMVREGEG